MSEENNENLDLDLDLDENIDEPEYTDIEVKAIGMGWNPDKDTLAEGKEFIEAGEFVRNKPLFDEMSRLRKQVRDNKTSNDNVVEGLKRNNEIVAKHAYDKAVRDIKAEKKDAAEEQDMEKMLELDERLEEIQEDFSEQQTATNTETSVNASEQAWAQEAQDFTANAANKWYKDEPGLRNFADMLGAQLATKHPDDPAFVYAEITKQVKENFPDKFTNKQRAKPQKVATSSRNGDNKQTKGGKPPTKSIHKLSDLPSEVVDIAKTQMKLYSITESDYLLDYYGE